MVMSVKRCWKSVSVATHSAIPEAETAEVAEKVGVDAEAKS